MRRRDLLAILGSIGVSWPFGAHGQQQALSVIGFLNATSLGPHAAPLIIAFLHGLGETGFVEEKNVAIEYRWADGHYDRLPALAADLVSRKVDLIVSFGGTTAARAAKNATSAIPIIFAFVGDPVGVGLVASLARPGSNLTGFSNLTGQIAPKRLGLICELVPHALVIALLVNPDNLGLPKSYITSIKEAARAKGVQLPVLKARTEGEIDTAFASLGQLQVGGLVVSPDPFFNGRSGQLVALASRYAILAIFENRRFAAAGGLISYGIDEEEVGRLAGIYAGRILKGERPADLPVQQPTKFELVVNLKTAKALGLTVPPSILASADEVIE